MNKRYLSHAERAAVLALLLLFCSAGVASVRSQPGHGRRPHPGAEHVPATAFGAPLPGLDDVQTAAFQDGLESFTEIETMETGLGPVFNARSCGECHSHPAIGGAGPDLGTSRVTRIGRILNGVFDPLTEEGGMLLQARSVAEIDPSLPIQGERVPPDATLVSHRITIPLFGDGLIEAIPAAEILRRADSLGRNRDGIAGVPNMVLNPETGKMEVGRFGWKAHVSTLHLFAGDAYLNEIGITNATFPDENLPQGQPIPPGCDLVPGLEADDADVQTVASFMRFLEPPAPQRLSLAARQGQRLFVSVGCASCHAPALQTGDSPVAALRNRVVPLYSDLLLHDMGDGLDDGMVMGSASGRQWRTAPLWGLSQRLFFLHDGRATTPLQAALLHGGEAAHAVARVRRLSMRDQSALAAFLGSL
jgi:CxxC motif-containing protein (DUF1111 family)